MKEYQPPYSKSRTIPFSQVEVSDSFWSSIQRTNTEKAIFHQYTQLEKSYTIDNFRLVAKEKEGFREGYFYSDSDAHKWAEAAANILERNRNLELEELLDSFFKLVENAQDDDGYIFTYNQFHFPNKRWLNFQFEHELYVIGHLIEAVIAYYAVTKKDNILKIGIKAADLLVDRFKSLSPSETPGHEEIELALIKLYRLTKNSDYLELAEKFIEKRGKNRFFFLKLTKDKHSVGKRSEIVAEQRRRYFYNKSDKVEKKMSDLSSTVIRGSKTRFYISRFTGKYFQQYRPIRKMKKPEGHSVRFGYFVTAVAMLYKENGDRSIITTLEKLWDSMVQKRF